MDRILNSKQVAALLGVCKKVVERLARAGEIPAFKPDKMHWRYRESDIENWIQSKIESNYQLCRPKVAF